MRPAALLTLALVLAILPLPHAQAAGFAVEARLTVTSGTTATLVWKADAGNLAPIPMPTNATFVEARDADGDKLSASVSDNKLTIGQGRAPISVTYTITSQADGPFTIFPAQVVAANDSPVSVSIALTNGFTLAGYRDSDDRKPDALGVFRGTGPAYVQFLVLQPGLVDPGPSLGVAGSIVRREATASIGSAGAEWSIVTTYDTDVYSRSWEVHVPAGASVVAATSPFGPLATTREGDVLRVTTPYPVGYGLAARSFTVNMTLAAPTPHGGTFREINLSIRAAEDDDVHIRASLAPGLQYAGARVSEGSVETAPLQFFGRGPMSVGIAFLPQPEPEHVQFSEGIFVVDAPRTLEAAARATARNASEMLPRTTGFAYDSTDTRPFYVAYTNADVFQWEEGFYSNGLNTITIRASTLADAADGKAHLVPVGVLIHEATHGLVDRRLPDAPHDLSFLHEGLSRLAETHLEAYFPETEIVACQGNSCTRHSARPDPATLQAFHTANTLFDVAWHASDVPDAKRGDLYDYSGLVLHAFERRAPPGALSNALAFVNGTSFPEDRNAASTALLNIFMQNAPGTPEVAFLYPGRESSGLTAEQFQACLTGFVAPPYPWQKNDIRAPSGGCPASGYASREGQTLPTPPVRESQNPLPPPPVDEPDPIVQPLPPSEDPTTSTPASETPTGTNGGSGSGQVPGAVAGEDPPGSNAPASVPGFGVATLALALAFALVGTRRRS